MTTIADTLTEQHRACDELFAQAENAAASGDLIGAAEALKLFVADMQKHFEREEQVLFPAFEQATGQTAGPTMVMRSEHTQMRALFQDLEGCIEQHDQARFLGLCETLLLLMQQHNAKEEQMLYPMSDRALNDQAPDLLRRLADS